MGAVRVTEHTNAQIPGPVPMSNTVFGRLAGARWNLPSKSSFIISCCSTIWYSVSVSLG